MLRVPIPLLHAKRHVRDVMQVWIFQFPKQRVHAPIQVGIGAFHAFGVGAQSFEKAKRMELAVLFGRGIGRRT